MVLNVIMPDLLVTCPLDEAHRILKSRLQFHMVKCLKNHKLVDKIKCPWNSLHIIDKFGYEDHWRNKCEDLPAAMGSFIKGIQDTDRPNIAIVPSSVTDSKLPPMEEDWDAEPYQGTYDPIKSSEGKQILRSAIGLSKAKKKEWIRQERLRHQKLDEILPVQISSISEENIITCRTPRSSSIAMSANASMTIDEFNTSKISTDEAEIGKLPTNLRPPHAPSPGLTYTPDNTVSGRNRDQKQTQSDETFGYFEKEGMYGRSSDKWIENVMSEFERGRGNIDARSYRSSTTANSRGANKKIIINQPADVPKMSFAAATSGTKGGAKIKSIGKVQLKDEAACLLFNEPTNVDEDLVEQLTQRLADLESMQKKIQQEKADLLSKFPQIAQKSINLESNVANEENRNGSSSKNDKGSFFAQSKNGPFNEMPKCAANFEKIKKTEYSPSIERDEDFYSLKNSKSRVNSVKKNTNPFVSAETMLSMQNPFATELASLYRYEETD